MASTTFGTHRQVKRQAALAACGIAVLVAALVGVWRLGGYGDATRHEGATSLTASGQALAPAAAAVAEPRTLVYVVGSEDEAGFLRRFVYEIDALRASAGQPAQSTMVVVSDRTESQGEDGLLASTQYLLDTVGHLPGSRLFDLRTP